MDRELPHHRHGLALMSLRDTKLCERILYCFPISTLFRGKKVQFGTEMKLGPVVFRLNWVIVFFVVLTFGTFVRLGIWQINRAGEKVALQEALQAESEQQAIAIEKVDSRMFQSRNDELFNLHVALTGHYVNERSVMLVSRFHNGDLGYEIVTPFRLVSTGQLVLVNRGWTGLKTTANSQSNLPFVSGLQHLTAQIQIPDKKLPEFSNQMNISSWPIQMRGLNMGVIHDLLGEDLFPVAVRLTDGQPGVLIRNWPAVSVNINTNLGYALQWFGLALVVLVVSTLASTNVLSLLMGDKK